MVHILGAFSFNLCWERKYSQRFSCLLSNFRQIWRQCLVTHHAQFIFHFHSQLQNIHSNSQSFCYDLRNKNKTTDACVSFWLIHYTAAMLLDMLMNSSGFELHRNRVGVLWRVCLRCLRTFQKMWSGFQVLYLNRGKDKGYTFIRSDWLPASLDSRFLWRIFMNSAMKILIDNCYNIGQ